MNSEKEKSVILLQRLWTKKFKSLTTLNIINNYFLSGPTIEYVNSINFESLVTFLRDKNVILTTKMCLQRIHRLCILRHGNSQNLTSKDVNIRVFLAGFMIAYHSTHVFENMGNLETNLYEIAIPLFEKFERICKIIQTSNNHSFQDVPHSVTKDFVPTLFEYLKRFKTWKIPDENKLVQRIKHALIALYNAQRHLPSNEPEDSKIKIEFRTQIERLRNKMIQIGGIDKLVEFDEQLQLQLIDNDVVHDTNIIYPEFSVKNNEQLAHELLLDPNFQITENYNNPIFNHINELFNQSFWNTLEDDLKLETPSYVRILKVLQEIRDGLNIMHGCSRIEHMLHVVNIDYIRQKLEANTYTWNNCNDLILSIVNVIQHTESPQRKQNTTEKWTLIKQELTDAYENISNQPVIFCKTLKFLFDSVNNIRFDVANYRLRNIAPVIKDHGVDYERSKFQDKLNNGELTLERTENWIHVNLKNEILIKEIELSHLIEGNPNAYTNLHAASMLSLITNETVFNVETCPETLLLDVNRLSLYRQEYEYIITSTTIIAILSHAIITNNIVDSQLLTNIIEYFKPETKLKINLNQTITDITTFLEESSLNQSNKEIILRILKNLENYTSSDVYKIIDKRVKTLCKEIMKTGKVPDNINVARHLLPRIEKLILKLLSLTKINWLVHLPVYNKLFHDLLRK